MSRVGRCTSVFIRRTGRDLVAAALVALVGVVVTGLAAYSARVQDDAARSRELARTGEVLTGAVEDTVKSAITQLRSAQALIEASDEVTAVEFSRFALYQGPSPGMVAIGFARIVSNDEWDTFTTTARQERSQFVVQDIERHAMASPPPDRDAVPVWFIHHRRIAPGMLGVDLADDPERRTTIERALESDEAAITRHMAVLGGTGDYVEIYIPVNSTAAGGPGLVFAQLDLFDLIDEIVSSSEDDLDIDIADVTDVAGAPDPAYGPTRWTDRITVADRTWEIALSRANERGPSPLTTTVAIAGSAITLLAVILTSSVVSARRRRRQLDDLIATTHEKDVFLATVAHELRTPLTTVVGLAALLAEQWEEIDGAEVEELLQTVHSEATDLSDLIEDFLVAGRLQAGAIHYRQETVDVGGEIRRVFTRINSLHDVELRLEAAGPFANADSLRVRQIVRNLAVNANRYAQSTVRVTTWETGDRLFAEFRNDGEPVAPELVDVLFEPYQAGQDRKLTVGSIGLGLPVSRRLARAMGGDLRYAYEDGWCVFTIELPLVEPETGRAPMERAEANAG